MIEWLVAMLIALRHWFPLMSAAGSFLGGVMFVTTLSFLFTTPSLDDNAKGFLIKDFFLLAGCLVTAGEAIRGGAGRSTAVVQGEVR